MAVHNRGYYREQRQKHINRKKRIIKEQNDYWSYTHDGELSKGKIHCGCPLCRCKTNNKHRKVYWQSSKMWKHSDLQKIESMNAAVADYECERDSYEALQSDVSADWNWLDPYIEYLMGDIIIN